MFDCQPSLVLGVLFSSLSVIFIGISKAGLGGTAGFITTPLLSLIFPAKLVLGFMLPIRILADAFTIYHFRREWDVRNVKILIAGALPNR